MTEPNLSELAALLDEMDRRVADELLRQSAERIMHGRGDEKGLIDQLTERVLRGE